MAAVVLYQDGLWMAVIYIYIIMQIILYVWIYVCMYIA